MKVGQAVVLICKDSFMPPIGAVGEIVALVDMDGDYEVDFHDYPCPVPPGETWFIPYGWLIPLNGKPELIPTMQLMVTP